MISISGTMIGELDHVAFSPSRTRFVDVDGDPIVSSVIYADVMVNQGRSTISAQLADDATMLSSKTWVWLVYERSRSGKTVMFTIPSSEAVYNYASIRPL